MSAPIVSFDVVTFHARGAWPRFDGFEMTHSADGVATLADGSTVQFTATRHVKAGSPTETVATLYSAARRELTAARWEELRGMIRRAFTGHVRDMADGPRPASIKPGTSAPGAALPVDPTDVAARAVADDMGFGVETVTAAPVVIGTDAARDAAPVNDGRACTGHVYRDAAPVDDGSEIVSGGVTSGLTGNDWEPDAATRYYAQRNDKESDMAFGPTRADALASLAAIPRLVANTTRACYWRTDSGFIATGPSVRAGDVPNNGAAYPRLDALMRLKGETADTIARTLSGEVLRLAALADAAPAPAPVDPAPLVAALSALAIVANETAHLVPGMAGEELRGAIAGAFAVMSPDAAPVYGTVTGRSVDGAEYLTGHGMSGDRRAALVMPWADALAIAASEESKAAATRSLDCGVYGIKATPWHGPAAYTLADYQTDEREGAAMAALYGADA